MAVSRTRSSTRTTTSPDPGSGRHSLDQVPVAAVRAGNHPQTGRFRGRTSCCTTCRPAPAPVRWRGAGVLPLDPELLTGPGTGNSRPALHQAILLETISHGIEVRACHPDRAPPHGPDPALQAPRRGDRKGWLEPVTQVVPHQRPAAATRSPSRTTSPSTSMRPGNHAEPDAGTGVQNAPFGAACPAMPSDRNRVP